MKKSKKKSRKKGAIRTKNYTIPRFARTNIKITLIIWCKKSKKYSIISLKNTEIYPTKLLNTLLSSGLKFEEVADNKARFECNDIKKCQKKGEFTQNHTYFMSKKSKKGLIITRNSS